MICAIEAGKRGRRVIVLESNDRPGRKILISGGGRCNFTNLYAGPENFISENPDFCRSALARYTPADFIALIESHGIAYHEKKLGQLFCDGSAREVLDMLEQELAATGGAIESKRVLSVTKDERFEVETDGGSYEADSLVVATGGLSIPKIGATGLGYEIARQFGLAMVEPRPGLVPFRFDGEERDFCASLAGVSVDVVATANGQSFRENLLFTHDGLSGPAILQVSSYWREGDAVVIDLLPQRDAAALLGQPGDKRELATVLALHLPRRFAHAWCDRYAPSRPLDGYSEREIEAIAKQLHAWELRPAGTLGFEKAEVTVGGVDTRELSSRTMESRRVAALYFVGEVVDVTGWLGGYNFQWAWASGHAAGQAV
jgi:predicted Rossmann fold flavoprotein